jgi:hypothetical protein
MNDKSYKSPKASKDAYIVGEGFMDMLEDHVKTKKKMDLRSL